jgi:hypothetical protein
VPRSGQTVRMFRPREYRGGRIRVYGCSPGCLVAALVLSLLLTLLLNGCFRVFS